MEEDTNVCNNEACKFIKINLKKLHEESLQRAHEADKLDGLIQENRQQEEKIKESIAIISELHNNLEMVSHEKEEAIADAHRAKSDMQFYKQKLEAIAPKTAEAEQHLASANEWRDKYNQMGDLAEQLEQKLEQMQDKYTKSVQLLEQFQKKLSKDKNVAETSKRTADELKTKQKHLDKYLKNAVFLIDQLASSQDLTKKPKRVRDLVDVFRKDEVRVFFNSEPWRASIGQEIQEESGESSSNRHDELGLTLSDDEDDDDSHANQLEALMYKSPPKKRNISPKKALSFVMQSSSNTPAEKPIERPDFESKMEEFRSKTRLSSVKAKTVEKWPRGVRKPLPESVKGTRADYGIINPRTVHSQTIPNIRTRAADFDSLNDLATQRTKELLDRNGAVAEESGIQKPGAATIHGRKGKTVRETQEEMKNVSAKDVAARLRAENALTTKSSIEKKDEPSSSNAIDGKIYNSQSQNKNFEDSHKSPQKKAMTRKSFTLSEASEGEVDQDLGLDLSLSPQKSVGEPENANKTKRSIALSEASENVEGVFENINDLENDVFHDDVPETSGIVEEEFVQPAPTEKIRRRGRPSKAHSTASVSNIDTNSTDSVSSSCEVSQPNYTLTRSRSVVRTNTEDATPYTPRITRSRSRSVVSARRSTTESQGMKATKSKALPSVTPRISRTRSRSVVSTRNSTSSCRERNTEKSKDLNLSMPRIARSRSVVSARGSTSDRRSTNSQKETSDKIVNTSSRIRDRSCTTRSSIHAERSSVRLAILKSKEEKTPKRKSFSAEKRAGVRLAETPSKTTISKLQNEMTIEKRVSPRLAATKSVSSPPLTRQTRSKRSSDAILSTSGVTKKAKVSATNKPKERDETELVKMERPVRSCAFIARYGGGGGDQSDDDVDTSSLTMEAQIVVDEGESIYSNKNGDAVHYEKDKESLDVSIEGGSETSIASKIDTTDVIVEENLKLSGSKMEETLNKEDNQIQKEADVTPTDAHSVREESREEQLTDHPQEVQNRKISSDFPSPVPQAQTLVEKLNVTESSQTTKNDAEEAMKKTTVSKVKSKLLSEKFAKDLIKRANAPRVIGKVVPKVLESLIKTGEPFKKSVASSSGSSVKRESSQEIAKKIEIAKTTSALGLDVSDSEDEAEQSTSALNEELKESASIPTSKYAKIEKKTILIDTPVIGKQKRSATISRSEHSEKKKKETKTISGTRKIRDKQTIAKAQFRQALDLKLPVHELKRPMEERGYILEGTIPLTPEEAVDVMIEFLQHTNHSDMWMVLVRHKNDGNVNALINNDEQNFLNVSATLNDDDQTLFKLFIERILHELSIHDSLGSLLPSYSRLFCHVINFYQTDDEELKTVWTRQFVELLFWKHESLMMKCVAYCLNSNSARYFQWIVEELEDSTDFGISFRKILFLEPDQCSVVNWLLNTKFQLAYLLQPNENEIVSRIGTIYEKYYNQANTDDMNSQENMKSAMIFAKTGDSKFLQFIFDELKSQITKLTNIFMDTSKAENKPLSLFDTSHSSVYTHSKLTASDAGRLSRKFEWLRTMMLIFIQNSHNAHWKPIFGALAQIAPQIVSVKDNISEQSSQNIEEEALVLISSTIANIENFISEFTAYPLQKGTINDSK